MRQINKAWNLWQGDGNQYAQSTFTIKQDEYAVINAYSLCDGDNIIVLEIDDMPECTGVDSIARVYAILDFTAPKGIIGDAGRYILAREVGKDKLEIFSLNAYASVAKFKMVAGISNKETSGFAQKDEG